VTNIKPGSMGGVIHIDKALAGTKEENTKTGKQALHMEGSRR